MNSAIVQESKIKSELIPQAISVVIEEVKPRSSEKLNCPICHEIYDFKIHPMVLTCGHTFCITCLPKIKGSNYNIKCPLCGSLESRRINQIPINYVVKDLVETDNREICLKHDKELELFCKNDNVVICNFCVDDHIGHSFTSTHHISVKDFILNKQNKLKKSLEEINQILSHDTTLNDVIRKKMADHQSSCDKFRTLFIALIEKIANELLSDLNSNYENFLYGLSNNINHNTQILKKIEIDLEEFEKSGIAKKVHFNTENQLKDHKSSLKPWNEIIKLDQKNFYDEILVEFHRSLNTKL